MDTIECVLEIPLAQFIAGAVVSALVSLFFSLWGSKQLRSETEKLHKLNVLTIRILDEAKLLPENIKPTKDGAGEYTGGITKESSAHITAGSTASINAKVIRRGDTDIPKQEPKNEKQKADDPDKNKRDS